MHDIPLLVETGAADRYDLVVVVEADERLRLERLAARGLRPAEAWSRIRAQAPAEARAAVADVVIDNDGTPEQLAGQVDDRGGASRMPAESVRAFATRQRASRSCGVLDPVARAEPGVAGSAHSPLVVEVHGTQGVGGGTMNLVSTVLGRQEQTRSWQEDLYRDVHSHPELSHQESRTAGLVADRLEDAGSLFTAALAARAWSVCCANGDGPTVLLRADMDALPVREATGLVYASTELARAADGEQVPVMHACGHDMHVACLARRG